MSITDLACDCCGAPMTMSVEDRPKPFTPETVFSCTKCKQRHYVSAAGNRCLILAKLYPMMMDENSAIYREFLEHRRSEEKFYAKSRLLAGLMTIEDHDMNVNQIDEIIDAKLATLKPPPRWWQFWR